MDDSDHLFDALLGLRRYFLYHGQIGTAHELSRKMLELAEKHQRPFEQARACMMLAEVLLREGAYHECAAVSQQGMDLSETLNPRAAVLMYGNETYLGCQSADTIALWHLGWPDRARRQAQKQLALSEALSHPFTHEYTLYLTAAFYILLREPSTVQRLAEEELRIAEERGFAIYQALGAVQLGWALAVQGHVGGGLEWIQKGMDAMQSTQSGLTREVAFAHLGEALILAGQISRAIEVLEQGLEALESSGGGELEAEFYRLKAGALCRQNRYEEAEQTYNQAIQSARRQSSRGWELRAALDLARLWQWQGNLTPARNLVKPLYQGYSEGLETPDLREARLLLDHVA
jgi:tetratricopeptide (TPR) repeat protein